MKQRLKDKWLVQGDANTKLFHGSLKKQQYRNRIYSVTADEGEVITDYDLVQKKFREYYIALLGTETKNASSN